MKLEYYIKEEYSAAIMGKALVCIVEGPEDVPIYESLRELLPKKKRIVVRAIDTLAERKEGKSAVLDFMKAIHPEQEKQQRFLACVDADADVFSMQNYRDELRAFHTHVLSYYSIESYACSEFYTDKVLRQKMKAMSEDLRIPLATHLTKRITEKLIPLYELSLLCLYNATTPENEKIEELKGCSYSELNRERIARHQQKIGTERIKDYAQQTETKYGLDSSLESMKKVIRGKELQRAYFHYLKAEVDKLDKECKENCAVLKGYKLETCPYCSGKQEKQCSYKGDKAYQKTNMSDSKSEEEKAIFRDILDFFEEFLSKHNSASA